MYIGLDLGTSGIKALLIDGDQRVIGSTQAPLTVTHPHAGWSEQNPKSWITAAQKVMDELANHHLTAMRAVQGIGLSGHMHGATFLDKSGKPLRDCILWNDTRSHAEAAKLDGDPRFRAISGNIVFPGFTAPKLAWVQAHEPDIFARVAKVLLPKDYLRYWLTGDYVSDMSDAAGTSWLNVAGRCWSDELLNATNLTRDHMPDLVEGSAPSGQLRPALANDWGMGAVTVAGGGGDNAASAIGMGVIKAGSAFVSLGTSGVLFAANDAYSPKPESAVHTFCHALPDSWHQMGVILSATDSLNWWARICGSDAAALTGELDRLTAPSPTMFLPYLSGERTPHNDATVRGSFHHMSHSDDRRDLTQSVMEGVAFALRDCFEALKSTGTKIDNLLAVGGGTKSPLWLSILANVLNRPIDLPVSGDFGAAFGAARLGMMAASGDNALDVCYMPKVDKTYTPTPDLSAAYGEKYQRFRSLYKPA